MDCTNCGQANPPGAVFCKRCGTASRVSSPAVQSRQSTGEPSHAVDCTSCGARISPGLRFCTRCGTPRVNLREKDAGARGQPVAPPVPTPEAAPVSDVRPRRELMLAIGVSMLSFGLLIVGGSYVFDRWLNSPVPDRRGEASSVASAPAETPVEKERRWKREEMELRERRFEDIGK